MKLINAALVHRGFMCKIPESAHEPLSLDVMFNSRVFTTPLGRPADAITIVMRGYLFELRLLTDSRGAGRHFHPCLAHSFQVSIALLES
jgi:hypothetical protein